MTRALKKRYGRAKAKPRVKSAEELAQETEFSRRENNPRVEKQFYGPGTWILKHHQLGEIGSKTDITRRGKVVSVLYVLPSIESLRAKKWWPEPDALFNATAQYPSGDSGFHKGGS